MAHSKAWNLVSGWTILKQDQKLQKDAERILAIARKQVGLFKKLKVLEREFSKRLSHYEVTKMRDEYIDERIRKIKKLMTYINSETKSSSNFKYFVTLYYLALKIRVSAHEIATTIEDKWFERITEKMRKDKHLEPQSSYKAGEDGRLNLTFSMRTKFELRGKDFKAALAKIVKAAEMDCDSSNSQKLIALVGNRSDMHIAEATELIQMNLDEGWTNPEAKCIYKEGIKEISEMAETLFNDENKVPAKSLYLDLPGKNQLYLSEHLLHEMPIKEILGEKIASHDTVNKAREVLVELMDLAKKAEITSLPELD